MAAWKPPAHGAIGVVSHHLEVVMFTTIVTGEVDMADVFYLIAAVLAGLGAGVEASTRPVSVPLVALLLAVGFAALGLLVL